MSGETRMCGRPVSLVQPAQLAFCPQPVSCSRPMFCPQPSSVPMFCRSLPLSYIVIDGPAPQPPLVFLHGLLGSKGNFRAIARALVQRSGRKPDLVERLVSVDISPTESVAVTDFLAYISAMRRVSIPSGIPRSTARRLAEDQLRPAIQVSAVRQFLLTNLVEAEGRYMWRVNLDAISHHMANIMGFPVFHTPYPGPTLFLAGSDSPYVSSEDYPEIERLFPEAEIQYIPGAGHWVHADKSQEFIMAICNFLLLP
ncbi:sn-1-specific diacylglycerol lipase ABHD11 isoform X2 [Chelonoidis abingdonii]|uniref:sn-1-specific diacylglycerol lipase ABHD11 isoform X2 n=1 Tax=Chelonoidis abingdonii TaxID=106734 RepID=UPI0013F1AF2C|nr:protein ABHD11 isoform X3 [Chelonoidis abingdonii]